MNATNLLKLASELESHLNFKGDLQGWSVDCSNREVWFKFHYNSGEISSLNIQLAPYEEAGR